MNWNQRSALVGAVIAAALTLTACGSSDNVTEPAATTQAEVSIAEEVERLEGDGGAGSPTPSVPELVSETKTEYYTQTVSVGDIFLVPQPTGIMAYREEVQRKNEGPLDVSYDNTDDLIAQAVPFREKVDLDNIKTPEIPPADGGLLYRANKKGTTTITSSYSNANGEVISAIMVVTVK
jgi:hypothetical protein